jgi:cytochrome c556
MNIKLLAVFVVIGSLLAGSVNTDAAEDHASNQGIRLSPGLVDLLRAEMREISGGVQGVPLSLATADWESIQQTSANLHASYIMKKKLTSAQADELKRALPEQFKQLDSDFHQRAEKLGEAAAAHDVELVVFHYSRMLESCARCHSAFASDRFPGFSPPAPEGHQH